MLVAAGSFVLSRVTGGPLSESASLNSVFIRNTYCAGASSLLGLVISLVSLEDHFLSRQVSTVCAEGIQSGELGWCY